MNDTSSWLHTDASTPEQSWSAESLSAGRPGLDLAGVEHMVVVAAHPDDETLMAGGLIVLAERAGIAINVVVATDGDRSHPLSPTHAPADLVLLRHAEVVAALHLLAPSATVHPLGFTDGDLTTNHEDLVAMLVGLIGTGGASTLLVSTWRGDRHPDHEAAAVAAASAAWRTDARLLEAPIWLWHWGSPRQPLPSGPALRLSAEALRTKIAAMGEHRSQVEPLSHQPGDEAILSAEMLSHFTRDVEVFFDGCPGEESPFESLHAHQQDPWRVHSSFFEQRKRALTMAALPSPVYDRVLELGCSVGALAADLATRARHVMAVDESASALRAAERELAGVLNVDLEQVQVPEGLASSHLHVELAVVSEIGYFLSPARLRRLGRELRAAPCETVVACHWRHDIVGWPLDGAGVHTILQECLGVPPVVSVEDPDFVLDVFVLDAGRTA